MKAGSLVMAIGLVVVGVQSEAQTRLPASVTSLTDKSVAQCVVVNDDGSRRVSSRRPIVVPDLGCGVRAADVAVALRNSGVTLVDTRSTTEFNGFHIDGALNLSVSSLRTKTFLRGKKLILMGSGKADRDLYMACAELRASGFKDIQILQGGVPAWLRQGLPSVGNSPDPYQLSILTPSELFREGGFEGNVVLVTTPTRGFLAHFPKGLEISEANPDVIRKAIERWQRSARSRKLAAVILIGDSGIQAEQWAKIQSALGDVPLMVHNGTSGAYDEFLVAQRSMWAAQAKGPRQGGCPM